MSWGSVPGDLVQAVRAAGISDERVLEAIGATPRAGFVPGDYVKAAYRDEPIPIGHGQVTTQPSLSARMIEGLGGGSGRTRRPRGPRGLVCERCLRRA
ncbi:MAG TPA: hypothetical protein VMV92_24115 [Streptosporangiaceae bacterium]|nr:hypothetical protein [Streptosporangiaceae bacterium]